MSVTDRRVPLWLLLVALALSACSGGAAGAADCLLTAEEVTELTDVEMTEMEVALQEERGFLGCTYTGEANDRLYSVMTRLYVDAERGEAEFDAVAEQGELLESTGGGERIAGDRGSATLMAETADGTYMKVQVVARGLVSRPIGAATQVLGGMLEQHAQG